MKQDWLRVSEGDTYKIHRNRDDSAWQFTCKLCYSITLTKPNDFGLYCPYCQTQHSPGTSPKAPGNS